MDREIKFRGKRIDINNDWVCGKLLTKKDKTFIVCEEETSHGFKNGKEIFATEWSIAEVDPETVGQFIGQCDKNGKEACEKDIIKSHYANASKAEHIEVIVFRNGCFKAESNISKNGKVWVPLADGIPHLLQDKSVYMDEFEIIGNISDNPELLKEAVS